MADALDRAVEVSTGVTIDWEELGRAFSEQYANDQAYFLLGMWEASTDSQAAEIGSASIFRGGASGSRAEVAEYLRLVADAIEKGR